jgi:hypothetical protein
VGARFSGHVQTGPEAHPATCTVVTGSFSRVKVTTHHHLAPRLRMLYLSFYLIHRYTSVLTYSQLHYYFIHFTSYQPDNNVGSIVTILYNYRL